LLLLIIVQYNDKIVDNAVPLISYSLILIQLFLIRMNLIHCMAASYHQDSAINQKYVLWN